MKVQLLVCCVSLFAVVTISAQGNIPKPTHEIEKFALSPLSAPEFNQEYFYYYNGNGDQFEIKNNRWDGTNWVLQSRFYNTLNANGQPTLVLHRIWDADSAKLIDNYRYVRAYQSNGLQTFEKGEKWDVTLGIWETEYTESTTYNSSDKVLESIRESFDNGAQYGGNRQIYQYDPMNRQSQVLSQYWNTGVWENSSITDYSYFGADADNYEALIRYWDANLMAWGPVNYRSIQTATLLETTVVDEYPNGSSWIPNYKKTTTSNNDGQVLTIVEESWNIASAYWKMKSKFEYTYNTDKSIHKTCYSIRDGDSGIFYLWFEADFDYGNYPVSTHSPTPETKVVIYSNPTADFVQVELGRSTPSNLILLDLRGNVISSTTTVSTTAQLSLLGQPAGTYFLRVEQGGVMKVLPVVKK